MKRRFLLVLGVLALLAAGVAVGALLFLDVLKTSQPYQQAMAVAENDARVIEALGAPVKPDWYVLGSVSTRSDGTGHADFTIPLLGSKQLEGTPRSGRLHVVAVKAVGAWTLTKVELITMTGPTTFDTLPLLP